jgi:uncharacterized protein YkwD
LFARPIHLGLLIAVSGLLLTATPAAAGPSPREASLLAAVNGVRKAHHLRPLAVDARLARAARGYSRTLLRQDVLTHGDFGGRMRRSGARGPRFGENLAWGTGGYAAATSIVRAWMRSPGHRANLLRPGFRRIGIGALVGSFAGYGGAIVVTADFAGS